MKKAILFLSFFIGLGTIIPIHSKNVNITISNIKAKKGSILLALFTNEKEFTYEKPKLRFSFNKSNLKDGKLQVSIPISDGTYGISVLDDINGDNTANYNFLGIPTEGFGFSNYYLKALKKPKFKDFCFKVTENNTPSISIKMKYLL